MTCDRAMNPNAAEIEEQAAKMAERFGLLRPGNGGRFDAFNSIVAHTYPTASVQRGLVNAQWSNWLFFFDDMHDEDLERCRNVEQVARSMSRFVGLLRNGGDDRGAPPLEQHTIDLHERLLAFGGEAWLDRFCTSASNYLHLGVLRAVENWASGRTPPLDEYLVQREHDSSMHACIDMIEIAEDISIPDEIRNSAPMRRARRAAARNVAYFNDIVSYPKEVLVNRNPNNLLHVLISESGMTLEQAAKEALRMVNQCANDLLDAETELASVPAEHAKATAAYLRGMRYWQRGNVEWSLEGQRYASPWSPMVELLRPLDR
ncbi:MAG: hypothetical protein R3B70_43155 [Polyangiaceae bacterium]